MKLHQLIKLDANAVPALKNDKNVENVENVNLVNAKVPKIEISRFDGSLLDWPRFWGQFTATVDKRSVAPVNMPICVGFCQPRLKLFSKFRPRWS
jgi:hypothetical protein